MTEETVWTRFMDMASGGSRKEKFAKLYIEAPEAEAKAIFFNRFGHNPDRVSCTCCGADYSIDDDYGSLEEASQYDRKIGFGKDASTMPLSEWLEGGVDLNGLTYSDGGEPDTIEVIRMEEIADSERSADIPTQGFVWAG